MQAQYEDIARAIDHIPEPTDGDAAIKAKIRAAAYRASARLLASNGMEEAALFLSVRADAMIGGVPDPDDAFDEPTTVCAQEELL